MKKISLIVHEDAVLSAVSGVLDIITHTNRYLTECGKPEAFTLELISEKKDNRLLYAPATFKCYKTPAEVPSIMEFMDVNTSIANSKLTPGGIGQITGSELKFNPDNKGEGIFFIDGAGIETQAHVHAMRTEGRLMFIIPTTLTPGTYIAEVRKGYGKTINLRSGSLSDFLQVA